MHTHIYLSPAIRILAGIHGSLVDRVNQQLVLLCTHFRRRTPPNLYQLSSTWLMSLTHHRVVSAFGITEMAHALVSFTPLLSDTGEENVGLFLNEFAADWISLGNNNVFINLMVK